MGSRQVLVVASIVTGSLGVSVVARAGGDAAAAKAQSLACEACHVSEASTGSTPHLAGQRESYLAKQLNAFKTGDRKHAAMNGVAIGLSDSDIANLAAYWSSRAPGSDTTVSPQVAAIKKSKVAFPRAFPNGFTLYSTANKVARKLVSRAYVNPAALQAAKTGASLPDGSVIVVVNYAPRLGADKKPAVDKDGIWVPDQLTSYEVMESRRGWTTDVPELLRNGNWGFGVFGPDKVTTDINQALCFACHKATAASGFVYELEKIQARASARP